ncbi:MAG: metallophosphoesterase [Oscillospiraceae bacterium]|nr:metallophosphoesterase [Oscillospiraceae bacterium]
MKLEVKLTSKSSADGIYKVTAKGCIAASLYWADEEGALPDWTAFAYVPVLPNGTGTFRYVGGRTIPPGAEYVLARAVYPDFMHTDEVMLKIPDEQKPTAAEEGVSFCLMSDMHLSNKPWKIKQALLCAPNTVLIAGDLVNDGTPEQLQSMSDILAGLDRPVFAVSGNHDYPIEPLVYCGQRCDSQAALQAGLLKRAAEDGYEIECDESGAYAARKGNIEIIGLNIASHWRKFDFSQGEQLRWLEAHLDSEGGARWRIILCHAPLIAHNPQRPPSGTPYFGRNKALQSIINSHRGIIFVSGHTHISPNDYSGCVEFDCSNRNIYINDGSICPTTYKSKEPLAAAEWTDGVVTDLVLGSSTVEVCARSLADGRKIARGYYSYEF